MLNGQVCGSIEFLRIPNRPVGFSYPLFMAFVKQATHEEKQFPKLSEVPLLRAYADDPKFCKSGIFYVEHLVPPGRFQNFTMVNYTLNVRVNVSPNNEDALSFLKSYFAMIEEDPVKADMLGCQIRDRQKGFVDIGIDDKKTCTWEKKPLGFQTIT